MNKRGAIELSIGTIVIVVLGVTMLILGMFLVRGVMCSAMSLTGDVNSKMTSELEKYFGETGDEVACIGEVETVKIIPGKENFIYCSVKAPEQAKYEFSVKEYGSRISTLTGNEIKNWIGTETSSSWTVAPDERNPKKVFNLKVPKDAPEGNVWVKIEIKKDGKFLREKKLDFETSRVGFIKSSIC